MQRLIDIVNRLQDAFSESSVPMALDLPQIAVVGDQSAGKSSVLENIVGRDFLPRGTGIVTRRPLVLQLINSKNSEEYGEFLHLKGGIFTDFQLIRQEIQDATERIAGKNKGITAVPINLRIYSPHVPNLTLIDLPGMTKVPVGDQPPDIELQIKDLIYSYIKQDNCLILAVTGANTDLATSEALKMAKECDTDGKRTLGVITKLDLMDAGTNANDVLSGRVIPVKLGIIGIVNRSQRDINNKKPIKEALISEERFLRKHYHSLAKKNGSSYLAQTLNRLLINHIRECLPEIKNRVNEMISENQILLDSYGKSVPNQEQTLMEIITKFASAYCCTIEGTAGTAANIDTTELSGGARIYHIFHETFCPNLDSYEPMGELSTYDILTAIRNATGLHPAILIPEMSFKSLVKRQILHMKDPCLRCVTLVHEEMQRMVHHCGTEIQKEMLRFPKLYDRIVNVVTQMLRQRLPIINAKVEDIIEIELAYINTKHPDFHDAMIRDNANEASPVSSTSVRLNCQKLMTSVSTKVLSSMKPDFPNAMTQDLSPREKRDCELIEKLINTYFLIIRKRIQDSVPKTIVHFLVNYIMKNLVLELYSHFNKRDHLNDLLEESEEIASLRRETTDLLKALHNASNIIGHTQEMHLY